MLLDSPAMIRSLAFVVLALSVAACSNKKKSEGLAPAQDWGADPGGLVPAPGSPHAANPHGANPHAGMDMGGDPNDPHAGVDMGGGGDPTNPHAGVDMGGATGSPDVSKMGLPAPDPNRPIDPTHHVKGTIVPSAKAASLVKPGTAVFVIVKRADPTGAPTGAPLAVEKLIWQKDALPFELSEADAMIAGTQLTGDVVVVAHYDQDGDAISKQPGDILGQLRVTVPATNVKLTLDQILP